MLNPQTIAYTPAMIIQIKRQLSNNAINPSLSNSGNATFASSTGLDTVPNSIENSSFNSPKDYVKPTTSVIELSNYSQAVGDYPASFWRMYKFQIAGSVFVLIAAIVIYYEYSERKKAKK
jgi:hypothetical protein